MEGHIRDLQTFLREYGATDLVLDGGGKHQKLRFVFKGIERWFTVPHSPSGDAHASRNNEAQLRRMLGPPIKSRKKSSRTMEEMMDELNEKTELSVHPTAAEGDAPVVFPPEKTPSKSWQGTVAAYKLASVRQGCQVYIIMPTGLSASFPNGFHINRLDDENWKLSPGGRSVWQKNSTTTIKGIYIDHDLEVFGTSPAEAVLIDGELLIHQAKNRRKHVRFASSQRVKPLQRAKLATPPLVNVKDRVTALEDQMREILRQVVTIEALCPYRFIRLESGKLLWRAPTIEG